MSLSRRSRILASLASAAVVFSTLVPGAAIADEPAPQPTPTVEPTAEPTATPTAEPTPEPTVEPTAEPTASPTAEPTAEPTPAPSETPTATPHIEPVSTYSVAGTFARLSSEDRVLGAEHDESEGHDDDGTAILTVPGQGFLRIDTTQLTTELKAGTVTVRLAVPAELALSDDKDFAFQQLAVYSTGTAPLVAQAVLAGRVSARSVQVNQSPNTPAVHEIFAVLVTPNGGGRGADQTPAKVATAVANTNSYWSQQSGGSVQFHLAGTTTWYSSASSCATDAGSTALWNQAAAVAASQLGYAAARNVHLVLFFPGSYMNACGGAAGLGTIGWSANEGGAAWVVGTDAAISMGILSHELGHNLSLGHAQWVYCQYPAPPGDLGGCITNPYGDLTDVMGYSQTGRTGGALSSPGAIRAGIWPSSAYTEAPVGYSEFTLNSVSSNTGLRSVILVDPYEGDRFYIEFRDLTDEDAQYAGIGCTQPGYAATSCAATVAGVRVLRLTDSYGFAGFPGDDSLYLTTSMCCGSSANQANYVAGQGLYFGGVPGLDMPERARMVVQSISGGTATIRIWRPSNDSTPTVHEGFVSMVPTLSADSLLSVGDTWTAMLGTGWIAENYDFQWKRNGIPIGGATDRDYTIVAADLGKNISVSVTGSSAGAVSKTASDPSTGGYGPVIAGVYRVDQPGSVAIDNSSTTLQAVASGWPSGTGFAYQWFKGATAATATTAIAGAGSSGYTPGATEAGQFIRVRVTATPPGYAATVRYSAAGNYLLTVSSGSIAVSGTLSVGVPLTVLNTLTYTGLGQSVVPSAVSYQWLRNGTVALGTGPSYTPVPADFGQKVSVRATASAPGYLSAVTTSPQTAAIGKGALTGTFEMPEVDKTGTLLTLSLPVGSIDTPDVTTTRQWFRGGVAIAGAIGATYQLTSADYGQLVSAKVTIAKLNYNSLTLQSAPTDYSVVPSASVPTITGEVRVGSAVTVTDRTFMAGGSSAAATESIQWYRSGVAIPAPLGTAATYLIVSADSGKVLTARVTASVDGFLPAIGTSTPTQPVGMNSFDGWNAQDFVSVTQSGMTLTAASTGITGPGALTLAYQWFRGTTAVAGSTRNTYVLTAADYALPVWVRVTTSKAGFTTVVKDSTKLDYSISSAAPTISSASGFFRVGTELVADPIAFTTKDGTISPVPAYQWLRNGVALAGATSRTYTPVAADLATKLTVRVTAAWPGYVTKVATSAATVALAKGEFEGSFAVPIVVAAPSGVLTASMPVGSVTTAATTAAWQWLRNGAVIPGATAATFTLTAAEYGKAITVRATISKLNFTSKSLDSTAVDYSVTPSPALPVLTGSGAPKVGDTLGVTLPDYSTKDGPATTVPAYQWLRNGVVIAGATQPTYVVIPGDLGTNLTARVSAPVPGYVASVTATPTLGVVAKGVLTVTTDKPIVTASNANVLSVEIVPGTISQPATTLNYQWLRDGVTITGATAATYTLGAADAGRLVSVRVTASKLNALPASVALAESERINYSIFLRDALDPLTPFVYTITGDVKVSETVGITLPEYSTREGVVTPTLAYQWFRGTAAIAGATQATYVVQSADFNQKLQVRVTATSPRAIANVGLSTVTGNVAVGEIKGFETPVISTSPTAKLTVVVPTSAPTTPGVTFAYQWLRAGAVIAGATASTFQLTSLDINKPISVRVTISKPNSGAALPKTSAEANYSVQTTTSGALPEVTGISQVSELLSVTLPDYSTFVGSVAPTFTYVWLRNDIAITGATGATYLLQPSDLNTRTSVRVTASMPGYLANIITSGKVGPAAVGVLKDFDSPVVTTSVTGKLTATMPLAPTTTPGATFAYQWLRDGVAIAGATTSTFQLTAIDWDKLISVRVTVSKAASSPSRLIRESTQAKYSVLLADPNALPTISGALNVNETLSIAQPDYEVLGSPASPTFAYVWLRNGVAIAGATGATYVLQPADFGTKTTVRVTASVPGYIPAVKTAVNLTNVAIGTISGFTVPTVSANAAGKLTAVVPTTGPTTPGVSLAYQWLRNNVAIAGATTSTFQLTSLDYDKLISVRVTITKPNSTTLQLFSTATDYSVRSGNAAPSVAGVVQVGETLTVGLPAYEAGGNSVTPTLSYLWLRNGVAIAGATGATYIVASSDYKDGVQYRFSVRVTAAVPGFVAQVATSAPSDYVGKGYLDVSFTGPTVTRSATGLLTASVPSNWIVTPATTTTYRWLRNGIAVPGATAKTYQLTAADAGASIVVVFRVTKLNMQQPFEERTSDPMSYTVNPWTPLTISGNAVVGESLTAVAPGFSTPDGPATFTVAYQWLRNGVAIAGATAATYVVQPADFTTPTATRLSVRVTGSVPSWVASIQIAQTDPVVKGTLDVGTEPPVVAASATGLLTASFPTIVSVGTTSTYQWLRDGTVIAGATTNKYQLLATDAGKGISVRIVVSKANVVPASATSTSTGVDYGIAGDKPSITGSANVGVRLAVALPAYSANGSPVSPAIAYQWFRAGVAIAGATLPYYDTVLADQNKLITVRTIASQAGLISITRTSDPTSALQLGNFGPAPQAPVVSAPSTAVLTASLVPGSITDPGITLAYQWLRNGTAIPTATAATYALDPIADYNTLTSVRVTVSKAGYVSLPLESTPTDYSIHATGDVVIDNTVTTEGATISLASTPSYARGADFWTPAPSDFTYQWYLNGVAVVGAAGTGDSYRVLAANAGKVLTVRVTVRSPGYLPVSSLSGFVVLGAP